MFFTSSIHLWNNYHAKVVMSATGTCLSYKCGIFKFGAIVEGNVLCKEIVALFQSVPFLCI